MMRYEPSSLVVTEREKFVPGLRAVTLAFATTAPVESLTVPCRSAAFDCACPKATGAERSKSNNKQGIRNDPLSRDVNDTNIVVSPLVFAALEFARSIVNSGSTFAVVGHVLWDSTIT